MSSLETSPGARASNRGDRRGSQKRAGSIAYLYRRDLGRISRAHEALEAGMGGVNTGRVSTAEVPFGGWKGSGLGREGGRHGLEAWTRLERIAVAIDPD